MRISHRAPVAHFIIRQAVFLLASAAPSIAVGQTAIDVDARGAAQKRATFGTKAIVNVKVVNKNPYIYRYRTSVNEETVQDTAPLLFVAQLSPLLSALATPSGPGASSAPPTSTEPSRTRLAPPAGCPAGDLPKATAALAWIDDERDGITIDERDTVAATRLLALAYSSTRAQIESRRLALLARRATSAELDGAASSVKQAAEVYPTAVTIDATESRLRSVGERVKALVAAIEDYRASFPACQPIVSGRNLLIADRVYLDGLISWWLEDKRAVVTAARTGREGMTALVASIDRVRAEGLLDETHAVGNYAAPTRVTVTVRRWALGDHDEEHAEIVAVARLDFGGGARFLISGGLGYIGGVFQQEFLQTRGYEVNTKGEVVGTELVPIVGLKRAQTTTIAPALLLNTRLWRLPENPMLQSIFGTLGITAKKTDTTNVDYVLGISGGTLDDRVIVTGAVYYGKEETLSGDLFVGAKVADDFTDIPVKQSYGKGFGLFVTYKIRVFSRICGSLPAPVADPTYGTGRFLCSDRTESRTPFWSSVSLCC